MNRKSLVKGAKIPEESGLAELAVNYKLHLAQLPYPPPVKALSEHVHSIPTPDSGTTTAEQEKERENGSDEGPSYKYQVLKITMASK